MSDIEEHLSAVQTKLTELTERLERHQRVVDGIESNPDNYDADDAKAYLGALDAGLESATFLDAATASLEKLEQATDEAEQAVLADAKVLIDDYEIEGVEVQYVHDDPTEMEASVLVPSPKVNQLRGGRPLLELPDGRSFVFTIHKTLIAEVSDDKSGYLELILGLKEA